MKVIRNKLSEITPANARTQSIESAVKELSKRESITMTDVRVFMDNFTSQKISTGKKSKYTDPNGDEHEYEVKAPISAFYTYKSDEKEIYSRSLENILKDKKFFHELPEDGKVSDVLKWAALNANFVETKDIGTFCIWLLNTIVEVKKTCKNGFVDKSVQNKTHLEFNSTTKGSGKSHFIEAFVNATKEAGIESKYEVALPEGGFYNTLEETKNLIVGYKERVYQKVDEATMMSIGRHEDYVYIEKGKMAINVPANAITIGSTNGNPYAKDDRCFQVINCLPASYEKRMEVLQTSTNFLQTLTNDVTRCNTTIYSASTEKVCNFVSLFKSVSKENEKNRKATCNKLQNYKIPGIGVLIDVVSDFTHDYDLLNFVSVKGLYKQWEKQTGKHLEGMQKFLSFEKPISEALNFLYSRGLVKGRGPSDDMKRQYDIFSILEDLKTLDVSDEVTTIEGDILKAAAEWERIIKMAEDFENNDPDPKPKKFLEETHDELPIEFFYKADEFSSPSTVHDESIQFVISNPPTKDSLKKMQENREFEKEFAKGGNLQKCNFVFEIDPSEEEKKALKTLPREERVAKAREYIEEQKRNVEKLPQEVKDSILSVTESGADSLHVILHTNNESEESRSEIWKYLSDKYFGGKADNQCSNTSRLTPNPNAIRNRKQAEKPEFVGQRQTCWYLNRNPKAFDVKWIENQVLKDREEAKRQLQERLSENRSFAKQELTIENLLKRKPSKARDSAISLLEGNCCHGPEAIGGMMYILSTGWDEYEMESVIDKGTWSQSEYDGMVKTALKNLNR